ncbi:4Fe-4S dicluster domain-containing protein [Magnetospirillum sp. SS-4]|uniref:4Fe-4S dicluster domain-containing protein n=1 Tax=Magnetospirillum sp. SS-4 TaxID=2681465 RepID=UPI0013817377|nr:4Fe-4S dicluster domain-containing protein [Magnetospirillum sp. SS-4]CAA7626266.1 Phenylacetyl-CoA:acceptor oxidoreductase [Magnetospirillum sp. SS-4]
MTRYVMIADLRRCVGCQTCTASCKETNGTPPGVQWRRVLDLEAGEYPDVSRVFVPTGCQHCDDPPCMEVCPSTATGKRKDGIVTIDYDICIGCGYCAISCPYEARYKVDHADFAYGGTAMASEQARFDPAKIGVATKCTFCVDRIDAGIKAGKVPGRDPEATPACVNSCISGALRFGDIEAPDSEIKRLIADNQWFRMHEDEGTGPGFYYIWDRGTL